MALTCNSPKQVILKYTSVLPQKISLATGAHSTRSPGKLPWRILPYRSQVQSPNPDAVMTWDFVAHPDGNLLEYTVTYSHAGTNDPPNDSFKAYFSGTQTSPGFYFEEDGRVKWQYLHDDQLVYTNEPVSPFPNGYPHPGLFLTDQPVPYLTNHDLILGISLSGGSLPAPAEYWPYSFRWNIYLDGNLFISHLHRSQTPEPPEEDIVIEDGKPGSPESEVFSFLEPPISVKLKLKEDTEYSYQVIAKYLDESSEVIHNFYGIEPDLLCFSTEDECPEHSCQVDCGEHYCCYGSGGISLYSFAK